MTEFENDNYIEESERDIPTYYIESNSYNVTLGTDTQIIEGRLEAVEAAKSMSVEHDRRVTVERTDGRVLMHFSNGSLDSFVWETRPGK
ncbi:hypothetical protein KKF91_18900 [Myxococcota bacterium]|nr:hypothetical protein [Myxococcota bacterium]MBU1432613.1 hypothetical protein [Myxococcota bacterium]MBU1899524.1 hypothetical protein [Myxococcota bacterium]